MYDYQEAYFDISISQCRISFLRHFALPPFSSFVFSKSDFPWARLAIPRSPEIQFRLSGMCEKYTARTWLKPNLACSDHLRLYGLVFYELRNSPKFNSDGKVGMKDSEKNPAVTLETALILSYNWHGEIGIDNRW